MAKKTLKGLKRKLPPAVKKRAAPKKAVKATAKVVAAKAEKQVVAKVAKKATPLSRLRVTADGVCLSRVVRSPEGVVTKILEV